MNELSPKSKESLILKGGFKMDRCQLGLLSFGFFYFQEVLLDMVDDSKKPSGSLVFVSPSYS